MKIKRKLSQYRRDFTAVYECEHCGAEEIGGGYDDVYFHRDIVPAKECKSCGKAAGSDYMPLATKYPADTVI